MVFKTEIFRFSNHYLKVETIFAPNVINQIKSIELISIGLTVKII